MSVTSALPDMLIDRSWHEHYHSLPVGTILVFLFGPEVPFVLATTLGIQSYKRINVAYVPGCGDEILDNLCAHSLEKTWISFAAKAGKEYVVVVSPRCL
jgi:hypothetical protein